MEDDIGYQQQQRQQQMFIDRRVTTRVVGVVATLSNKTIVTQV